MHNAVHARGAEDFTYLPLFIAYQYFFAALKLYAAFTLNNTAWGTRDANAFKTPEELAAEGSAASVDSAEKEAPVATVEAAAAPAVSAPPAEAGGEIRPAAAGAGVHDARVRVSARAAGVPAVAHAGAR